MNINSSPDRDNENTETPPGELTDFSNLKLDRAALITCPRGKQHVALLGPDWYAEIRRQVDGESQADLVVAFHRGHRELTETSDMQVVRFPRMEDKVIQNAEIQRIDGVPTAVISLSDDFRVLFSAALENGAIGVEFADPDAVAE